MRPRLVFSASTGRVYVVTRYSLAVGPDGKEVVEAIGETQLDVTADFDRVAMERAATMFPTTNLKRLRRRK